MSQWRQLKFFEKSLIESDDLDRHSKLLSAGALFERNVITASTTGLYLGDLDGMIHQFDKQLRVISSFKAFTLSITHLNFVARRKILLSLGEDDSRIPTLKVWNVEANVILIRSTKITSGNKVFPVTCLAYLPDMTQVAVGFENGIVVLIKGDLSKDQVTKSKIVYQGGEIITGLGFREDGETRLLITTASKVLIYSTIVTQIDTISSICGQCVMTPGDLNQDMVVVRDEAVHLFGPDGRGPCFIIDGQKTFFAWHNGYLIIVSREAIMNIDRATEISREGIIDVNHTTETIKDINHTTELANKYDKNGTLLTIYDLKGKYIAFRGDFGTRKFDASCCKAIGEPIKHVFCEFGQIMIVTNENKFFKLLESDLAHKLDVLFEQKLFTLAFQVTLLPPQSNLDFGKINNSQEMVDEILRGANTIKYTLMDICKRFGDDLYIKQDYKASMTQYIRTIGSVEASYVIRKFLDAQNIKDLTAYLKALHDRHLANQDHTTLLLNCYSNLRDLESLNDFIEISDSFHVENAINVCRSSGFHQQALFIASKFEEHEYYIKILIEDLNQFDDAFSYFLHIPDNQAKTILIQYAHTLVCNRPKKTTELFLKCFQDLDVNIKSLISFYIFQPEWCEKLLFGILKIRYNVDLNDFDAENTTTSSDELQEICNTLLDIQLDLRGKCSTDSVEIINWDVRILQLLEYPGFNFDLQNSLLLCKQHNFRQGELIMYEKLGLYSNCLEYYIELEDFDQILAICFRHGSENIDLWKSGIEFCAQYSVDDDDPNSRLIELLEGILSQKLMTNAEIIYMLTESESITLGMVRPFLSKIMNQDSTMIENAKKSVKNYRDEIVKLDADIVELESKSITFQATYCHLCLQVLQLPTIHYLCKHSYHANCLGDLAHECPKCGPEHLLIKDLLEMQRVDAQSHDQFLDKIALSNPFPVIIDQFSKNML